jgi:hypothetical protein
MIYQLPNGKIINISVEAYLRMSDEDLRYLNESEFGSHVGDTNPFDITEDTTEHLQFVEDYIEDLPEDIEFPDDIDLDEE